VRYVKQDRQVLSFHLLVTALCPKFVSHENLEICSVQKIYFINCL